MQATLEYQQYGEKIGSGLNGDIYQCDYHNLEQNYCQQQQQLQAAGQLKEKKYAVKVFKTATEYKCEEEALEGLEHPNVIKILQKSKNDQKMLMQFYENGDMFDFLQSSAGQKIMTEEVARYFFKQLVKAVEYIHEKNIIHRDLKLENILIDENFNLILSDFGLSTRVERGQLLNEYIGTSSYMAPEIVSQQKYYGQSTDVFAMGVILFCTIIGTYPFQTQALPTDPHYKYFANKNYIRYWLLVEKQQQKQFSSPLKSLINQLLAYDVNERITLEEIWEHPWMSAGPTATAEEIANKINDLQQQQQMQQQQVSKKSEDSTIDFEK